jgi:hypothetical protein
MDTPLHALAVPEADPDTLKKPDDDAREFLTAIAVALAGVRLASSFTEGAGALDRESGALTA